MRGVECNDLIEEENTKMDKDKGKVAILKLREAVKFVRECGADSGDWIIRDIGLHIEELQNEIGGHEHDIGIGSGQTPA